MHTDDHILTTFLASDDPLEQIAAKLAMPLTTLARWLQRNSDLINAAKEAMETRLKFLALKAETIALAKLSAVTNASTDEERTRKGATRLLCHVAKRLAKTEQPHARPTPARGTGVSPVPTPSLPPNAESRMPNASSSPNAESRMPNAVPTRRLTPAERFAARRLAALQSNSS